MKKIGTLFVFLSLILLASMGVMAAPIPVGIEWIEVEGVRLDPSGVSVLREEFRREDELNVRVRLSSPTRVDDVTVTAFISGYEFGGISDSIRLHRMDPGRALTRNLNIQLPQLMEDGEYRLRILVTDRNSETLVQEYDIAVGLDEHKLIISDMIFFEKDTFSPGESLYTVVRVRNMGDRDYDNARISVSVPELGIRTADFMNRIDAGESRTSSELFMRIPSDAKPGTYDVIVDVDYHHTRTTSRTFSIEVEGAAKEEPEAPRTVVSAATEPQTAKVGSAAVYPITISNLGSASKTYTLSIESAGDWAEFRISPSNLILLEGHEARTVFLYATPNANAQDSNIFVLSIDDGKDKTQVAFQTDVEHVEEDRTGFRRALEIGLIVLVVLLVVIGLIVAFTRLAARDEEDDDEEDDETTQTYY